MGNERDSTRIWEPDSPGGQSDSVLCEDSFYKALAATERRRVLAYLLENDESTLDELAATLVGWETSERGGMAGEDEYEEMSVELHHRHLPVLDEAGLVAYGLDSGEVTLELTDNRATELVRLSTETDSD